MCHKDKYLVEFVELLYETAVHTNSSMYDTSYSFYRHFYTFFYLIQNFIISAASIDVHEMNLTDNLFKLLAFYHHFQCLPISNYLLC